MRLSICTTAHGLTRMCDTGASGNPVRSVIQVSRSQCRERERFAAVQGIVLLFFVLLTVGAWRRYNPMAFA